MVQTGVSAIAGTEPYKKPETSKKEEKIVESDTILVRRLLPGVAT